ncbi:nickel-responsive transcriptional regulator NikR [Helicobacter valdiviensis]|uniref:Putative nickel-responsive regulator n=1 Tax=Helicobacter valdiviensis TaxID=1458358 RepID=A0A2W6MY37_9HELI|nr:nickel-responsive transcriptional regulator NikR [Helicobacter valdiviensis]PZT48208.1 nickel-responsive transcriptional regulator NikR [Helicobacter valdiviensis]
MKDLIRFCVSLPKNLLEELDSNLTHGYSSRSEVIRDLIREKIIQKEWDTTQDESIGVLTIIYNHHHKELNQKLIDLQHAASHKTIQILCTTHTHINDNNCLETIMLKGDSREIEELSLKIGGLKGVKFSKLTKTLALDD